MSLNFARPLDSIRLANDFITNVLSFDRTNIQTGNLSQKISDSETLLKKKSEDPTLTSIENRHASYLTNDSRKLLRREIFEELIKLKRLENDDVICKGSGGAKPCNDVKNNKQAYIITGLPASGKSSIASKISDNYGAYIVDSDYAKRKFPEFSQTAGPSVLHEESALVTFGSKDYGDEPCLFQYCIANDHNMVIPKIGNNLESLNSLKDLLVSQGYEVHLTLVCLDRVESCRRALLRYIDTDRYVPLGLVFDGYGNDPILTYYRIKEKSDGWSSTGKVSSLYLREKGPIYKSGDASNPASIFR